MRDIVALAGVLAFAGGVLGAGYRSVPLSLLLFLILLAVGFFLAWHHSKRVGYVLLGIVILGFVCGMVRTERAPTTLEDVWASQIGTTASYEGIIVADPDVRETSQRLTVEVTENGASTKILVVAPRYPLYAYGDYVTVTGKLEYPKPFDTDGGRVFAYDMFLAKDGILSTIQFAKLEKHGESHAVSIRIQRVLYSIKHGFAHGVEAALPEPHASLAEGLLVGGKQGLGKELLQTFTIAGLLPIIVLSGYNVMIIAEGILLSFAFLRKRVALILAGITIILFVLAAGGGSSATRAGLMATLALYARATYRTYDALRILIAVFFLMILWNPLQLQYDPGFQFSFMATLGLILLSSHLERRLHAISWQPLRDVVATTLSAQLFVLPLLLYQTGNLSLVAIPANILVLPFIPLTMLLSFVAGLVGIVLPTIAFYLGLPAYVLLSYTIHVAEFCAHLPLAQVIVPAFPFAIVVFSYVGIWWFVRTMRTT